MIFVRRDLNDSLLCNCYHLDRSTRVIPPPYLHMYLFQDWQTASTGEAGLKAAVQRHHTMITSPHSTPQQKADGLRSLASIFTRYNVIPTVKLRVICQRRGRLR